MLDKNKCDEKLGMNVNNYLVKKGVQTPLNIIKLQLDDKNKKQVIESLFKEIMETMGLDLNDDSLKKTPYRISKMYIDELFWGLKTENFPKCMTVDNKMKYDEMVLVKNIKVISSCEHHQIPIISDKCFVAYIPKKEVIGLSKINRIVEYFSRRPQIQERLTEQIYYALEYILGTSDIAVVIDAEHLCVKCRGVEDINSSTVTSKLGGKFMEQDALRAEFMSLIKQ